MQAYRIKNWAKFQHYKDRNPPWIKLHVEILQSEDWVTLADASRLLAIVCMIVAAKDNGVIPGNLDYIKRVAYLDKRPNLKPLIDCGFLEIVQADASAVQADARPEKEAYSDIGSEPNGSDAVAVVVTPPDLRKSIFDDGLPWLATAAGKPEPALRSMLGKWCRDYGDEGVLTTIRACMRSPPVDPVAWIERSLKGHSNGKRPNEPVSFAETVARLAAEKAQSRHP